MQLIIFSYIDIFFA